MATYDTNMPFIDCELTEGVIKLLSDGCGYIFGINDIERIAPGLSDTVKKDVMSIMSDIFET